jgi:arabinogalactan endo-1,4-beta-galactosidase
MNMNRPTVAFSLLCVTAVAALTASALVAGPGGQRRAIYGEATIHPIESDIAAKFWASTTATSGASTAAAAIDQDPSTAWLADGAGTGASLTLDLGGAYDNVRKVEVLFPDVAAYRYRLAASPDGDAWQPIADRSANRPAARGAVHLFTRPGTRYLRLSFEGASPGARIGVSEIRAFNYLRDGLLLGADLSNVDNFRDRRYYVNPNPTLQDMGAGPHLLDVVKDRGMGFIRLRIWNEPRNERTGEVRTPATQGPERSLEVARWVRERQLGLGIDFHYADSWADPGKQPKPRAWAELEFDDLVEALHDFTYEYVRRHVEQGTTPDKVAVGNEIINGFLWGSESSEALGPGADTAGVNPPYFRQQAAVYQSRPGGRILWRYWKSENPEERRKYEESWDRFATLVAAGIAAVREASPQTKVELHTIVGSGVGQDSGLDKTMEFWDQLLTRVKAKGQDPDVLAISYYAEWHGTVEQLDRNLHTIATTYPEYGVNIAETAYPATGDAPQPNSTFPRTIQGQADAIQRVFQAANDVMGNRGVGVLLWEPASFQSMFRAVEGMPGYFEPNASIDVFNRSQARHILENPVYVSARVGETPVLPRSVRVLTVADGTVSPVPVRWEAEGRTSAVGEVRIRGTTDYGEVTAVVETAAIDN